MAKFQSGYCLHFEPCEYMHDRPMFLELIWLYGFGYIWLYGSLPLCDLSTMGAINTLMAMVEKYANNCVCEICQLLGKILGENRSRRHVSMIG